MNQLDEFINKQNYDGDKNLLFFSSVLKGINDESKINNIHVRLLVFIADNLPILKNDMDNLMKEQPEMIKGYYYTLLDGVKRSYDDKNPAIYKTMLQNYLKSYEMANVNDIFGDVVKIIQKAMSGLFIKAFAQNKN